MNRFLCALTGLVCFALLISRAEAESPPYKKNLIPSWGDLCLVYGPGTDASMDTDQAMENMVRHWKGRGFTMGNANRRRWPASSKIQGDALGAGPEAGLVSAPGSCL